MARNGQISLAARLWAWGCSLKLAIYIASAATVLIMIGSLVIHFHPEVFGGMDQLILADWFRRAWRLAPQWVFWIPLTGILVVLFAINTLCCLIDWLLRIRNRWRKTGEYLIHTGFLLLVIAYGWNCWDGFRTGPHPLYPGEIMAVPQMPGYTLRLDNFEPSFSDTGRPLDMINDLTLLYKGDELVRQTIRFNHPLMRNGLVILPTSMGQGLNGFRFFLQNRGMVNLKSGSRLPLPNGTTLEINQLLADARQTGRGVMPGGDRLGNPAMQFTLHGSDGSRTQGWYFLRGSLPPELVEAEIYLRPVEPLMTYYSLLTINRDPGARLAMAGGVCLTLGVLLAFISFYYKRSRNDRPNV